MAFLDRSLRSTVANSSVFVVGAGGIGCELLKNLVLTGFSNITVIDFDTIDVSNLNRQFLFQKQHVGRSKVEVAKESVQQFNPSATIVAHSASIFNPEYNVDFFKQFSLVMNALDNKAARNHVNRLCLSAGITLVESGSAGYLGQVTVIRKGQSECYECQPKPAPRTYPGCTIRNTPSEPIHCIVWAKHLFSQLFGDPDVDNDVSPETNDSESEIATKKDVKRLSTRSWAEKNGYDPTQVFHKLFHADIKYLLSMEKLWQSRVPPTPLAMESLPEEEGRCEGDGVLPDQKVWSMRTCGETFLDCVSRLRKEQLSQGALTWDKDDKISMDFVVTAANLRAHSFNIPRKSRFDIKSMAGNIVPAIATTNAVIAGLIVMEALKILAGNFNKCRTTYLPKYPNPRKQLLVTSTLLLPNPSCYVCAPKPEATVRVNVRTLTLRLFQDLVLKGHFGVVAPDVEVEDGKGTIMLSSEEGETEDNLTKTLGYFGVTSGTRLSVDDFLQNYKLVITIVHSEGLDKDKEYEVATDEVDTSETIVGQKRKHVDEEAVGTKRHKEQTSDDMTLQ